MKLFIDLMKVFFIRAKDTKWIVLMTSIVITMVSLLYGVGDQIIYSYASALKGVGPDWDFALKELNEEQTEYYSNPESFHGAAGKIGIASGQFEMKIEGADAFVLLYIGRTNTVGQKVGIRIN